MRPEELLDFIGSSKGIGEGIRRMSFIGVWTAI